MFMQECFCKVSDLELRLHLIVLRPLYVYFSAAVTILVKIQLHYAKHLLLSCLNEILLQNFNDTFKDFVQSISSFNLLNILHGLIYMQQDK